MDDLTVATVMGEALVQRGLADSAKINSELAQMRTERGLDPLPAANAGTQDTRSVPAEEQTDADAVLNAEVFAGPDGPGAYRLPLPDGKITPENVAEVQAIQQTFFEAGLPVAIVAEFSRQLAEAAKAPPGDVQREQARQSAMIQLRRIYGDDIDTVLRVARAEFATMAARAPMLRGIVDRSGLGNSAYVISSLFNTARAKGRG